MADLWQRVFVGGSRPPPLVRIVPHINKNVDWWARLTSVPEVVAAQCEARGGANLRP